MPVTATEWTAAEELFLAAMYKTTLNGGIGSGDATLTVNDSPPATPPAFNLQIDSEIIRCTAVSGTGNKTFAITRAQQGSSAASHADTTRIYTTLSQAAGFMGGDGNVSIDLTGGRTAWIYTDPLYCTAASQVRPGLNVANQIVAIQTGYDLSTATLAWYPMFESDGNLKSFFPNFADPDGTPCWFWPGGGIVVGGKLIILGAKRTGVGQGQGNGTYAVLIDNPGDTPDLWNWTSIPVWNEQTYQSGSPAFQAQSLAAPGDGWLYAWADNGPRNYIARWKVADAIAGNLTNPQWWCGAWIGWSYIRRERALIPQQIAPGNAAFLNQSTQHLRPGDSKWQLTGIDDSASSPSHLSYAVMASGGPGGPFPALTNVYPIPFYAQTLNYAGGAHPEQTFSGQAGSDVVMAYTPGGAPNTLAPLGYLPKFVKVTGI